MFVRSHPGALLEGRKWCRIPSADRTAVARRERHDVWLYGVEERWIPQPALSANTHCRFRHPAVGSH